MRRSWLLLRAAWWGVLASQVDHLIRLSSLRRGPLLGAAALALLLAPLALVLHHGEAVSRGQSGFRESCTNSNSVVMGAPIPLANGSVRVMTTPYHGAVAPTMDLTLYCSASEDGRSLGDRHFTYFEGGTSPLSITMAYARNVHALAAANHPSFPAFSY
jgi:hypothetical protein